MAKKKIRVNLEFDQTDYDLLKKAQECLGEKTLTASIRRSAKRIVGLAEIQKTRRKITRI